MGRWLTKDPDGGDKNDPQSINPYLYADNDPVNRVDPDGRISERTLARLETVANYVGLVASVAGILAAGPLAWAFIAIGIASSAYIGWRQYRRKDYSGMIFTAASAILPLGAAGRFAVLGRAGRLGMKISNINWAVGSIGAWGARLAMDRQRRRASYRYLKNSDFYGGRYRPRGSTI